MDEKRQSKVLRGNSGKWEINKREKKRRIGGVEVGPAKGKKR